MTTETPGPAPQDPTATSAPPAAETGAEEAPKKRGPGRPGGIGEKIFEQVEDLVGNQGLSRTEAFQRISQETGRRSGTVAANYYRIARKRDGGSSSKSTTGPGRPRRKGGRSTRGGDASAALARAREALEDLSAVVQAQEKELVQLREQTAQLDKFKKWMEKNVS